MLSTVIKDAGAFARRQAKTLIPRYRKWIYALLTSHFQINNPAGKAPTTFFESTGDYVALNAGNKAQKVFAAEQDEKTLPNFAESDSEYFLRHQRGSGPDQFVYQVMDLRIVGTFYFGSITPKNDLLLDFSFDPWGSRLHPCLSKWRLPKLKRIEGKSAVLMAVGSESNYYHFTLDLMPQLRLLQAAGYDLGKIDHFVIRPLREAYQTELLTKAGIRADQILPIDDRHHYLLSEAILPQRLVAIEHAARWKLDYLRDLQRDSLSTGERRLFVGRSKATTRRLVNEEEVAASLASLGYEYMEMDSLSVAGQARIFSQAREIVGVHGAALTNIVYCRPGTRFVEIANSRPPAVSYWAIADTLGLDYALCYGQLLGSVRWREPHILNKHDFTVDLDQLKALVSPKNAG